MKLRDLFHREQDEQAADDPGSGDRLVMEKLRQAGADLSQQREVVHYLYVPHEQAAEALSDIVRNVGFEAQVEGPLADSPTKPWLVRATTNTVVEEETIASARIRLTELAAEYGGEYDGWEAAV